MSTQNSGQDRAGGQAAQAAATGGPDRDTVTDGWTSEAAEPAHPGSATGSTTGAGARPPDDSGISGAASGSGHRGLGALAAVILVPVLVGVMLTLFAWPAARLAPRELPIGVAGPPQALGAIEQGLARLGEGAFDVHTYADEADARAAIKEREVYGAIVAGPSGVTLLTASAASPLVAQLLQQAAPAQKTVDVVPNDKDDPRGVVLGASLLPLVLAGMAGAFLLGLGTRPGLGQALALIGMAALAGLVVVGIAQGWLSALGGDWWLNAGVFGLTILAIGAGVAGLGAVFGRVGLGLGAATMMLVGNPFSGLTSAPELLPQWAGVTGQYLPPGAGGTLLRSTAFFEGAAAGRPLLVLTCWAVAGLLLVVVGRWIRKPRANAA